MDALEKIRELVHENPVIIFMKGTPQFPRCGFSARASQALAQCGAKFAHVNIFEEPEIYKALPQFANWPTFPQIYIGGELVGGCDITLELYQRGELQKMIQEAVAKSGGATAG